jgi:uncharacterized protein YjhX (UPF0386 family)
MTRRSDPQHQLVDTALARLASQGTIFHYTHQNIAELWNAMTRPLARNGFGLTARPLKIFRKSADLRLVVNFSGRFFRIA